MTRFVVDCDTLIRIAAGEIEVAGGHQLVAPTLVRSQALATLYGAARRGEISDAEGIEWVTRINSLKVRFLGDKVLQRKAWKIAAELGWETTDDAEDAIDGASAGSEPSDGEDRVNDSEDFVSEDDSESPAALERR